MQESILIVDDDRDLQDMIRMALAPVGCRVHLANQGKEALEIVAEHLPQIVVLDVNLAGPMNGPDVCNRIKQNRATSHIFVLLISGDDQQDLLLTSGANEFLMKPFSPIKLREKVIEVLGSV